MRRPSARWVAAATATALVSLGIGFGTGAWAPAGAAADSETLCAGQSAPQNTSSVNSAPVLQNDTGHAIAGGSAVIRVLANDSDPDGDELFVVSTSAPQRGQVCVDGDGTLEYSAGSSASNYTDTFDYGVTDGNRYVTATVTMTVEGVKSMRASLVHRLQLRKHSKRVKRKASVAFRNPNHRLMVVLAGSPTRSRPSLTRTLGPGQTASFRTKDKRIQFFALVKDLDGTYVLTNVGALNTRNGSQSITTGDNAFFREHPAMRALQRQWLRR
jgi:hypothetical protein